MRDGHEFWLVGVFECKVGVELFSVDGVLAASFAPLLKQIGGRLALVKFHIQLRTRNAEISASILPSKGLVPAGKYHAHDFFDGGQAVFGFAQPIFL
jgi:hypothetical protein